jgi:hypothetical protein
MKLFDAPSHEPLTDTPWNESRARRAIHEIVADAEAAFNPDSLWPNHPLDDFEEKSPPQRSLYLGAAGMLWALHELARTDDAGLERDYSQVADWLHEGYLAEPDDFGAEPAPSYLLGESGILLAAERWQPDAERRDLLLARVRENEESEVRELMWGSPGTMLVAQALFEATGEERWLEAWHASADRLWVEWQRHEETGCDLWTQHLYGKVRHIIGPVHGFAGNVFALWRGRELMPDERRSELEQRAVATYSGLALREDGLAQWLPEVEPPDGDRPMRTQWCHGAPGMVATGAGLARGDDDFTQLLVAGGELTWRAGPLVKGPGFCHGTAGNGYAFLKLLDRTGDELWLNRARRFAMHAIEQVERLRTEHGRGRYTLWTGDVGTAFYLRSCLDADPAVPGYDLL